MVSSYNFLTLYVGLELQSLALYILASFNRHSTRAPEAGMKYFILGALASGMMLFGISFVYGFVGHTGFDIVGQTLAQGNIHDGVTVGLVFILIGIAFKLSAVPFHMWTPDVYQGAPASVTAFFAMVPKIAAIALLLRICISAFADMQDQWVQIIYFLAAASMVVGAFAGLAQQNIRRLLAYSAIGNMGYALMGLVALGQGGLEAVIIYMFLYMVMTAGVFGILMSLRHSSMSIEELSDLSGLSKTHPFYAYIMAIMMFSMAGIPPLAGFFGKLVVFNAAVNAGFIILAILGVITSVIAAFYYLRIIKIMFFDDINIEQDDVKALNALPLRVVLIASTVIICGFAFVPKGLFDISAHIAASSF
jgi:NADH-quinone oxidoreductase subunit N